jgi:endo-alpha-1,4-polygalactosaminidase (GH114 family)
MLRVMSKAACFAIALLFIGCSSDGDNPSGGGNGGSGGATGGSGGNTTGGTGGVAGSSGGSGGSSGSGGAAGSGGSAGSTWAPAPGTSWQWQLTGTIDQSVDVAMYDIDLFEAPDATIAALTAAGRKVICYFSAGSREDWRPDANQFQAADYGNDLDGWPGETWLDTRSENVRAIMKARLDLAVQKGCTGVEPDNVDAYTNDSGFPLTEEDQVEYDVFLADEAHARGLSVGLKNSVELVPQLITHFDWSLNEECFIYDECDSLAPFIAAQKAVFHVEYVDQETDGQAKLDEVCGQPSTQGFSTLVKLLDLDAWRLACP